MTDSMPELPDDYFDSIQRSIAGLGSATSSLFETAALEELADSLSKPVQLVSQQALDAMPAVLGISSIADQWLAGVTKNFSTAFSGLAGINDNMISALTSTPQVFDNMWSAANALQSSIGNLQTDPEVLRAFRQLTDLVDSQTLEDIADSETEESKRFIDKLDTAVFRIYVKGQEQFATHSPKAIRGLQILYCSMFIVWMQNAIQVALVMTGHQELADKLGDTAAVALAAIIFSPQRGQIQGPLQRDCPTCGRSAGQRCVTKGGKAPGTPTKTHAPRMK